MQISSELFLLWICNEGLREMQPLETWVIAFTKTVWVVSALCSGKMQTPRATVWERERKITFVKIAFFKYVAAGARGSHASSAIDRIVGAIFQHIDELCPQIVSPDLSREGFCLNVG